MNPIWEALSTLAALDLNFEPKNLIKKKSNSFHLNHILLFKTQVSINPYLYNLESTLNPCSSSLKLGNLNKEKSNSFHLNHISLETRVSVISYLESSLNQYYSKFKRNNRAEEKSNPFYSNYKSLVFWYIFQVRSKKLIILICTVNFRLDRYPSLNCN